MNWYPLVKQIHVACGVLAIAGLFVRGLMSFRDLPFPQLQSRWLRVLPHVNDTLLLAAAIALAIGSHHYPFVDAWLTAKVFGVIAYIVLGSFALRPGCDRRLRAAAWLAALATFAYIVSVALGKDPTGFFAYGQIT